MAKFAELNTNLMSVLNTLISSQDLCKLLYYNHATPLSAPNFTDTSVVMFNQVYPFYKVPSISENDISTLSVIFDNMRPMNTAIKNSVLIFVVLCHIDIWRLTGTNQLRPYAIANRIDLLFNEQRVAGMGKMYFERANYITANEKYAGYELRYRVTDLN